MIRKTATLVLLAVAGSALAAPVTYNIDSDHTYPAFEADHMGGLSIWRGKFNKTRGKVVLDTAAKTGEVDITIDMASVDFGHDGMNTHAKNPDIFDVARFPTATYKGKISKWNGSAPAEIDGQLTMKGVTKPVSIPFEITGFIPGGERAGAKIGIVGETSINRRDFGVNYGNNMPNGVPVLSDDVKIVLQIEAAKPRPAAAAPASE